MTGSLYPLRRPETVGVVPCHVVVSTLRTPRGSVRFYPKATDRWLGRSRTWYDLAVSARATSPRRWPRPRRSEPPAAVVVSLHGGVPRVCDRHGRGGPWSAPAHGYPRSRRERRLVRHGAASDEPGSDPWTTADSRPERGRARPRSSTRGSTAPSERRSERPGVRPSGRGRRRTKRRPRERTRPARRGAVRGGPRPRPDVRVREWCVSRSALPRCWRPGTPATALEGTQSPDANHARPHEVFCPLETSVSQISSCRAYRHRRGERVTLERGYDIDRARCPPASRAPPSSPISAIRPLDRILPVE